MNTYTNQVWEGFRLIYVVACLVIVGLPLEATAKSRPARPTLPEGESLIFRANDQQTNFVAEAVSGTAYLKSAQFVEGWSGTALLMAGETPSHCMIPVQGTRKRPNFSPNTGSIRLWFSTAWSSTSLGGQGSGKHARLLEIAHVNAKTPTGFALYFDSDGNTVYLSAYQAGQAVDIVHATVALGKDVFHQLGLVYGPEATSLVLDGKIIATGRGLPALAQPTDLDSWMCFLGSNPGGLEKLEGQLDEIYFFPYACTEAQFGWDYQSQSLLAAMGPVSVQESIAHYRTLRRHHGPQRAEGWPSPPDPGPGGGGGSTTNDMPFYSSWELPYNTNVLHISKLVYDTNGTALTIAGGETNGVYDLFYTTNLVGNHVTNSQWTWFFRGAPGQTNFVHTNAPVPFCLYLVGATNDTDGDLLTDAYILLVSKTATNLVDTDGDGMPDIWELKYGLNPLRNDAEDDFDGDWVSNYQEYINQTNPRDDMIFAWGDNFHRECLVPPDLRDARQLAGGYGFSLALRSNGTVVAWGGLTNVPAAVTNVAAIGAAWYDAIAWLSNGTVIRWNATTNYSWSTNGAAYALGYDYVLCLRSNGTLAYWGQGSWRTNLGRGPSNVMALAAGANHAAAVLSNGQVTAWGQNAGSLHWNLTNVPASLSGVATLASGYLHTLALRSNGTVSAWGYPYNGLTNVPAGLSNVAALVAGMTYSLALDSNGTLHSWGPLVVPEDLTAVKLIGGGARHALALRTGRQTPVVLAEPISQSGLSGTNITLNALGYGLAGVKYQWLWDGSAIAGSTNASYTVTNLSTSNEGAYQVVIATGAGARTSRVAQVVRLQPPVVSATSPGVPSTLWASKTLMLAVYATANSTYPHRIHYQWKKDGATLPVLEQSFIALPDPLTGLTNFEGEYTVQVYNAAGGTNVGTWTVQAVLPGMLAMWGDNQSGQCQRPANLTNLLSMAAGETYSLALRGNGTVLGWGSGAGTNVPAGLSNVVAVAAGYAHGLALQADGAVVAWGDTNNPALHIPANLGPVASLSAGSNFCLALLTSGEVVGWGVNDFGQTNVPPGSNPAKAIAAGAWHGVALRENGTVAAWGNNQMGQTNVPASATNILSVTAGRAHTLAVRRDGRVLAWGLNDAGQCDVPAGLSNVTAVAAGANYSVALKDDGTLVLWGQGVGVQTNEIASLNNVIRIAGGGAHALALGGTRPAPVKQPGMVAAWGRNLNRQCEPPPGFTNAVAVAAGETHSVAVREDGTVLAWGNNDAGQCNVPGGLSNIVAVAAGYGHNLALDDLGRLTAWGDTNQPAAVLVPTNLMRVSAISAGSNYSLALLTNGQMVAWGVNAATNVPADLTNVIELAAGAWHGLAVTTHGTVVGWGNNAFGQTNVPPEATNAVAVAAGRSHSLALRRNGTVVAWGDNTCGQTNVPAGLNNVMAIAAGATFSVALKNDRSLVVWGQGAVTILEEYAGLSNVVSVAGGGYHALATLHQPSLSYPVTVEKDLLLIYNTNSTDSLWVKDYYLAHRPFAAKANVLGIGCTNIETVTPPEMANDIGSPFQTWLNANPTLRPQYIVLFLDVPSRVNWSNTPGVYDMDHLSAPSVSVQLHSNFYTGILPFVTHINMGGTNDCRAYIDKLEFFGTNYSLGKIVIRAHPEGYSEGNYYFDECKPANILGSFAGPARQGVLGAGVPETNITFITDPPPITRGTNVLGYVSWGTYSLGRDYVIQGSNSIPVLFYGNSGGYLIQTVESYNGVRDYFHSIGQGTFCQWFSSNAFGGINFSNTPMGAASHVGEPYTPGINDSRLYFGLWASGHRFCAAAWVSARTHLLQIIGDPIVIK